MTCQAFALVATFVFLTPARLIWSQTGGTTAMVTGTVTYRQRVALPPGATFEVRVEDISRADVPAANLADWSGETKGRQVPIPFELKYDPSLIVASHRYNIRATISSDGEILFTTTSATPVITQGAPTKVDLILDQVTPSAAPSAVASPSSAQNVTLEGTYWKLTELSGRPAVKGIGDTEAHIILHASDKGIVGSSGCNRIVGGYELDGDSLHFKPAAMTMMACSPPLMKQEKVMTAALQATTTFRIEGHNLELLNASKVEARFQARYLK